MCNLYSATTNQEAIRGLFRVQHDRVGNLPWLPGIFPDYAAPIVRNGEDGRELVMARWGMPSPVFALQGKNADKGVTNIRVVSQFEMGRLDEAPSLRSREYEASTSRVDPLSSGRSERERSKRGIA